MANRGRDPKKTPKPYEPTDFLPDWQRPDVAEAKAAPKVELKPEDYKKRALLFAQTRVAASKRRKAEAAKKAERRAERGKGSGAAGGRSNPPV